MFGLIVIKETRNARENARFERIFGEDICRVNSEASYATIGPEFDNIAKFFDNARIAEIEIGLGGSYRCK